MSTAPAVTMQELELERAELLPSRETLCVVSHHQPTFSFAQVGYGDTAQSGLINVGITNSSLNILSLGSGNIL
jgi:hypothetical protein